MTEPATPPACPACGYTVGDGAIERCPECGAATASFASIIAQRKETGRRRLRWCVYACASWPLICGIAVNGLMCLARLALGRWPQRFGMDDPKGIPVVQELSTPVLLMFILIPVTAVAGLVLWVTLMYVTFRRPDLSATSPSGLGAPGRSHERALWSAAIGISLWIGGIVLLRTDPTEAFMWLLD